MSSFLRLARCLAALALLLAAPAALAHDLGHGHGGAFLAEASGHAPEPHLDPVDPDPRPCDACHAASSRPAILGGAVCQASQPAAAHRLPPRSADVAASGYSPASPRAPPLQAA